MIKTILVPGTGDSADIVALEAALSIAREFAAHLDVLHLRLDATETALSMASDVSGGGGVLIGGFIDQLEREACEREDRAKRIFDEFCVRENLAVTDAPIRQELARPTGQWHVKTGDQARSVAAHGMAADLIVSGRGTGNDRTMRSVLETALLDTGRPLLIPSAEAAKSPIGSTVAIAWKQTAPTIRAVAAAMPFILRAKNVILMSVDEAGSSDNPDRLLRNLAYHGCRATAELVNLASGDAVEALLAAARGKAELLVMGGYGHSQVREWMFGGFTQRVLDSAPLPVLMAH